MVNQEAGWICQLGLDERGGATRPLPLSKDWMETSMVLAMLSHPTNAQALVMETHRISLSFVIFLRLRVTKVAVLPKPRCEGWMMSFFW